MTQKREDYISWDQYFIALACLSAMRSKDPSTQVGACIVDSSKRIVGIGYNGLPNGCSDDEFPWAREAEKYSETKYAYVCHAELNAILNNKRDMKGCTLYTTLFPCNECVKLIIQVGIEKVVYVEDKYHEKEEFVASRRMLDSAKIPYEQYQKQERVVTITL